MINELNLTPVQYLVTASSHGYFKPFQGLFSH